MSIKQSLSDSCLRWRAFLRVRGKLRLRLVSWQPWAALWASEQSSAAPAENPRGQNGSSLCQQSRGSAEALGLWAAFTNSIRPTQCDEALHRSLEARSLMANISLTGIYSNSVQSMRLTELHCWQRLSISSYLRWTFMYNPSVFSINKCDLCHRKYLRS